MRTIATAAVLTMLFLSNGSAGQTDSGANSATPAGTETAAPAGNPDEIRQELETLKKQMAALEQRLNAKEEPGAQAQSQTPAQPALALATTPTPTPAALNDLAEKVNDLDQRVSQNERGQALDRLQFSGDYRFEAHT